MGKAYLLLGGNVGDRKWFLDNAGLQAGRLIGPVERSSSLWETEPWGFTHETPFLNQVIILATTLRPEEIMEKIRHIEQDLGRIREKTVHYAARTIDIDILFYDDLVINQNDLIIPHPRIQERRFVLEPLAEVEPELVHPLTGTTVSELLAACGDRLNVRKV
jgi:2-amino-4-hydroxy-6-hydroxymethyldihydropteridine diphosphokinase